MKWEILGRRTAYAGFFHVEELHLRHELGNGQQSPILRRELLGHGDAVAVLPYDPVRQSVVLIEQFRTGLVDHGTNPWVREIVAGFMEPGETPEHVARRELMEETGCEALALHPLLRFLPSPGALSERVMLFLAEVDATQARPFSGRSDEGEDIRTHVIRVSDVWSMLALDAPSTSASTIIALQCLAQRLQRSSPT